MYQSAIQPWQGHVPQLGQRVYVHPQSAVIGQVTLGDDSSVWPFAAIRGDVNTIAIGKRCNIQDGAVLHVTHDGPFTPGGFPLLLGDDITVGHGAVLHACTIEDACLIGMNATVLDGAVVGRESMIAAGSLVPPGKVVEPGSLWMGNPARFVRRLSEREIEQLHYSTRHYVALKDGYLEA